MKILVLLKQTPDTEAKISITGDGKSIDQSGMKFIINPYDEFAIEEALKIKQQNQGSEVVIVSYGGTEVKDRILKGLAMGADRGMLVSNEGLPNLDALSISKVLCAAIKVEQADLVLGGKQGIDDDNMHVTTMTAELLGWPHVNVVTKMEVNGSVVRAEREIEGGQTEVFEVTLPAVFGANKALNTPRYASLPGIMKAKKKPFDKKTVDDLGLNAAELESANKTLVKGFRYPAEKPAGKMFKDDSVEAMVSNVVKLLREEAKIV